MFDFDKLNQTAQSHQDLAQKETERNKELLKKQEEIESQELIEYLCAYLSPFVERLANDVISRNGKKEKHGYILTTLFLDTSKPHTYYKIIKADTKYQCTIS